MTTPTTDKPTNGVAPNGVPDGQPGNGVPLERLSAAAQKLARARLAALTAPQRPLAPRDGRWWAGAAVLAISMLLLSFVGHVVLFSSAQYHRSQELAYADLRDGLARATVPVGQLDQKQNLVEAGTPIALLEIPSLGLTEVVFEGSTSQVLRSGPGHRRDTVMPGQAGTSVVMGRQLTYGRPFGTLDDLQPGDRILVTTGQTRSTFQVFGLRRAGDPLPEPLATGQGRLELMTADGLELFPSGVLHVDAQLTSEVQTTPSKVLAEQALPDTERAMGGDRDAWFIAFFFGAFFLAGCAGMWWLWTTWGRWHAWVVGTPVLLALGVTLADRVMDALPNLL